MTTRSGDQYRHDDRVAHAESGIDARRRWPAATPFRRHPYIYFPLLVRIVLVITFKAVLQGEITGLPGLHISQPVHSAASLIRARCNPVLHELKIIPESCQETRPQQSRIRWCRTPPLRSG